MAVFLEAELDGLVAPLEEVPEVLELPEDTVPTTGTVLFEAELLTFLIIAIR